MVKKEEFYKLHAGFCKSIFNPKRLAIIDVLRRESMNVNKIAERLETSQSNISQHLGILKTKGLVSSSIKGSCTYYHITSQKVFEALDMVNKIVEEKIRHDKKIGKSVQ